MLNIFSLSDRPAVKMPVNIKMAITPKKMVRTSAVEETKSLRPRDNPAVPAGPTPVAMG